MPSYRNKKNKTQKYKMEIEMNYNSIEKQNDATIFERFSHSVEG